MKYRQITVTMLASVTATAPGAAQTGPAQAPVTVPAPGADRDDDKDDRDDDKDDIVVTAGGFEQQLRKAPASISVVPREELETRPYRDLTDALRNVEGVSVTGGSNEQDIFIRGLPGAYTLMLVDGRRQSTRDARPNGSAGFEQSFLPPVGAIERIEVVRGPMSTLYGSDAIGGVINVITQKVPRRWGGSLGVDYTLQLDDKFGDNNQMQGYVAGPVVADTVGVQLWGRRFHREEARTLNGFNGWRDTDLNGRIAVRPAQGHEIVIEAGAQRLRRRNSPRRVLAANANPNYNTNDRDHYAAWYDGRIGAARIWASAQQEETQRYTYVRTPAAGRFVRDVRAPNIRNRVADLRVTTPLLDGVTLVAGGQYIHTRLIDQNPGSRRPIAQRFEVEQRAGFVEAEWRLLPGFSVTAGTRLDDHRIYGTRWTPRAYGVWEPVTNLVVKGGVSTGFRAPEIRQIVPGYAYTTGGGGCTYGPNGTCAVIVGDPDLGAERSTNYEIGVSYDDRGALNAGVTLFSTTLRDRVADVQRLDESGRFLRWSEDPNYRLYEWTNIERARLRGAEATVRWKPVTKFTLRGGYTFTDSEQQSGAYAGYPLARTPRHRANGQIQWTPASRFTAYAAGWYNGREINAALRAGQQGTPITTPNGRVVRAYPGYFLADVGGSLRLPRALTLNVTVQNITDRQLDDLTYNTVNDGRRLWVGLTAKF